MRDVDLDRATVFDSLEKLILSCSDQQIFVGSAYAVTLRFRKGCTISAYHYNIVTTMLLLTCVTHLMSITIVSKYWEYPLLGFTRTLLMTGIYILTGVEHPTDPFPTHVPMRNETNSLLILPAACFQSFEGVKLGVGDKRIQGWFFYIPILLWYSFAIIHAAAKLYLYWRRSTGQSRTKRCAFDRFPWIKWIPIIFRVYQAGGIGLSSATVVFAFNYIMKLRAWMDRSGWINSENGVNPENDPTSFGQLVAIFSGLLTVFAFIEVINGNVHSCISFLLIVKRKLTTLPPENVSRHLHHKKTAPIRPSNAENIVPAQNSVLGKQHVSTKVLHEPGTLSPLNLEPQSPTPP